MEIIYNNNIRNHTGHKWGLHMTEAVYITYFPFVAKTAPYFLTQEVLIENLIIMNQKASLRDGQLKGIKDTQGE